MSGIARSVILLALPALLAAGNWPQWRGPDANGVSHEKGLPVEWDPQKNVLWKAPLRGLGSSTPIVWGRRLFITSQIGDGPVEQRQQRSKFPESIAARTTGESERIQLAVEAFDIRSGKLVWEYRFDATGHLERVHKKHNLATPSCVTDGRLIYAWFGTGQLVALTMNGKLAWSRHIGREYQPFKVMWRHGSSPVIYRDTLILLCDHDEASYILGLDKRTGEQRWKIDRAKGHRSYSTPLVVPTKVGGELVVNSTQRVDAYGLDTRELLWHVGGKNNVPVPSPVHDGDVIYISRGFNSGPFMAIKPGGRGDIANTHVIWEVRTGAPYVSSLLHHGGLLYMATENGIATCIDASTGEIVWRERVGGVFSASPLLADGKLYLVSEDGETVVLKPGRRFELLARNDLAERTLASPVAAGGMLLIRTDNHLIAIRK